MQARPGQSLGTPLRVVIEGVEPLVDAGRYAVKRVLGERLRIEADAFADGHDVVACAVRYRTPGVTAWAEIPMRALDDDRFRADLVPRELGRMQFTVLGWVDHFATWQRDLRRRAAAGTVTGVDLLIGADLLDAAAKRAEAAGDAGAAVVSAAAATIRGDADLASRVACGADEALGLVAARFADRSTATLFEPTVTVVVEPPRARCGAWYELFPRSVSSHRGTHGTFGDVESRLGYVAAMGFDVLYLPPIHPVGTTHRKGRNNALTAEAGDVGSPWAIGGPEGGHTAVNPELGDIAAFRRLLEAAVAHGLDVALDLALQCSPDHPWVREHPEWFRRRPDGTLQYAENPPKKYEDIHPLDFETDAAASLWLEIEQVVEHWVGLGVKMFRVDNPHTKPFRMWEWLIERVKERHPEVLFLSEAFTRPKVMQHLAKLGFSQSYTYFTWRTEAWEITEYFAELAAAADWFRPNVWPNTPDILTEQLQYGGRGAFVTRFVLAATLAANYGIYGPAFELCEARAREPGSEEYLDSEKYQLREWDLDDPDSLRPLITRMNRIRRQHPALQQDRTLAFHRCDNEMLLCYSKVSEDGDDVILCVVNLDPHGRQGGFVTLDSDALGPGVHGTFAVHDVLGGGHFVWHGPRNYVELDPGVLGAHVFVLAHHVRTESDFDGF